MIPFGFSHSDSSFAFYHAEIVPWLTYVKRRVNSRIFQDLNVLGVLDKIYEGATTVAWPPTSFAPARAIRRRTTSCSTTRPTSTSRAA
ncbi:contractile injection system protein, VgrG/Pvc8 family [Massilia aquatica]|uniref:contractile injection system protein, VgrG/Pvc8 family n=1 Tax=Massilia aquatica TaxID=2609000 RepID=UPI00351D9F94